MDTRYVAPATFFSGVNANVLSCMTSYQFLHRVRVFTVAALAYLLPLHWRGGGHTSRYLVIQSKNNQDWHTKCSSSTRFYPHTSYITLPQHDIGHWQGSVRCMVVWSCVFKCGLEHEWDYKDPDRHFQTPYPTLYFKKEGEFFKIKCVVHYIFILYHFFSALVTCCPSAAMTAWKVACRSVRPHPVGLRKFSWEL